MKLWSRFVLGGLVLALALGVGISPASAAAKKKKKEEVVRHEKHYEKHVIDGLNIFGKPGYFFSDTADTLHQSQIAGTAHLFFDTGASVFQIPFGASYGISDKVFVNVNTAFFSANGFSGLNYLGFGGKYGFGNVLKDSDSNLKIAAGLDLGLAPLYITGVGPFFSFNPYGVCTWTLPDGWQFNGKLGLEVQTYSYGTAPYNFSGAWSYFQLDLGAAYSFDKNLTGIAELATNGMVYGEGVGESPLLVGIRTGHDVQLQAMAGLDLGVVTGLFIGGGVALFSE